MSMSPDWSEGYVTDTLYTDNVYREQSPVWINYVATLKGCVPRPLDAPFDYLELGCGLGHSITVFAAAFPQARFIGVDFNPAQIDRAQRRARALGLDNLTFIEASFQDIAADAIGQGPAKGLGTFDFVTLHGIYSWISPDARRAVQRIMFDRLKPGGLVYNSYNCLPGWAVEAPLQRLLKELSVNGKGNSGQRVRDSLARMKTIADAKSGYFASYPQAATALSGYSRRAENYLAHEFLNGAWDAFYSADIADDMATAKLEFVGSATLAENHGDLLMSDAAYGLANEQPDERSRQLIQDYLVNQKFRRDIFVRGHAHLARADIAANRQRLYVVAPYALAGVVPQVKVPRGMVNVVPEQLKAFSTAVADWAGTEAELSVAFAKAGGKATEFPRLMGLMTATGHVLPAAKIPKRPAKMPIGADQAERQTLPLKANMAELAAALSRKSDVSLISPVTSGVKTFAFPEVLLLNELLRAGGSVAELTTRVAAGLAVHDVHLAKDGKAMTDPAEITRSIQAKVTAFLTKELPSLTRIGVVHPA